VLEGDRPDNQTADESQDVQMSSAMMDESSMPLDGVVINGNTVQPAAESYSRAQGTEPAPAPAPEQPTPRPRMKISHDQYQTLKSLIILYLSEKERETGKGVDKDDLIDWYLESKEDQIYDVEQLEYEKEMITKALRKMVKVCIISFDAKFFSNDLPFNQDAFLIEARGDVQDSLLSSDAQESSIPSETDNVRVYYMVHPAVDLDGSSMGSGY